MLEGTIQSLCPEKGFGFIRPDDGGTDVFFHRSSLQGDFLSLFEGQQVSYELDKAAERPKASAVSARGESGVGRRERSTGGARPGSGGSRPPRRERERDVRPPDADCLRGFVTKLRRDEPHGFISADAGGVEIRFEPPAVVGEKRFRDLIVGDYVVFAVTAETLGTKTPAAYYVREIERTHYFPQTQLSRHPKSRRKKPTWR